MWRTFKNAGGSRYHNGQNKTLLLMVTEKETKLQGQMLDERRKRLTAKVASQTDSWMDAKKWEGRYCGKNVILASKNWLCAFLYYIKRDG
jgi:hypothetical protein